MSLLRPLYPFEVLVDLMADHDSQTVDGSPVSRVEGRLQRSLALARRAGIEVEAIFLDTKDHGWLCNAKGIDRLSTAASRILIDGIRVERARHGADSHIIGRFAGMPDQAFPTIQDPCRTPGFTPYLATPGEKAAMVENLRRSARIAALNAMDDEATKQ